MSERLVQACRNSNSLFVQRNGGRLDILLNGTILYSASHLIGKPTRDSAGARDRLQGAALHCAALHCTMPCNICRNRGLPEPGLAGSALVAFPRIPTTQQSRHCSDFGHERLGLAEKKKRLAPAPPQPPQPMPTRHETSDAAPSTAIPRTTPPTTSCHRPSLTPTPLFASPLSSRRILASPIIPHCQCCPFASPL